MAERTSSLAADAGGELEEVLVIETERWQDGPPHELFRELRGRCPVHWSAGIPEFPEQAGFWSVTRAEDIHAVWRDWETYSSELGGITALTGAVMPLELRAGDVHRHGPAEARPPEGAVPARLHAEADRRPRAARSARSLLERSTRLAGREECDLVAEVAQPIVSRVIGSFMGIPPEDDAVWARMMNATMGAGDRDLNPDGRSRVEQRNARDVRALQRADRRAPRAPDRRPDERARACRGRRRAPHRAGDRDGLRAARGGG